MGVNLFKSVCVIFIFKCATGDSYIDAYKESQNEKLDAVIVKGDKNIDREFIDNNAIPYQYGQPSNPNQNYGPPVSQYGPPSYPPSQNPVYGAPNPPPPPAYGPPAYGPPAPPPPPPPPPPPAYGPPIYGPPSSSVQVFYGMPHALNSFWEKLKFKLDLFTIGKILLKLVLFKKFVSFVAIICLLLFIPSLKNKLGFGNNGNNGNNDDIGERSFHIIEKLGDEQLNQLYASVYTALDNFSYDVDKKQYKNHSR